MSSTPQHPTELSHINRAGDASMVDVGAKPVTERFAQAEGFVRISEALETRIRENSLAKGSVFEVARVAGVLAAKRTDELIPLCHTLPLDGIDIAIDLEARRVRVRASVHCHTRTGVEMEALTAVTVACLTVIDMGKAVDRSMIIEGVRVLEKRGGRSGTYRADAPEAQA